MWLDGVLWRATGYLIWLDGVLWRATECLRDRMEHSDGRQSACAIRWSTLTGDRMLDAIGWSTLTADTMFATFFLRIFRYRDDRFGRGITRFVAIWLSWRYIKNDFSGKSLQSREIHFIFAVRKTKNLKQVTTNKNNNPLKNIRLWSLSHSSPSQSLLQ